MPTIKNPNPEGRQNALVGVVGPGETVEVSQEVADQLVDGANFVLVDAPKPKADAPSKKQTPTA